MTGCEWQDAQIHSKSYKLNVLTLLTAQQQSLADNNNFVESQIETRLTILYPVRLARHNHTAISHRLSTGEHRASAALRRKGNTRHGIVAP